mmetsp:Transcript_44298/g.118179  ORF Transcript_44298/g.118179 Transcript_44298/m.118179 type:complete len:233 (-) Transcript_44298:2396-3094(-)
MSPDSRRRQRHGLLQIALPVPAASKPDTGVVHLEPSGAGSPRASDGEDGARAVGKQADLHGGLHAVGHGHRCRIVVREHEAGIREAVLGVQIGEAVDLYQRRVVSGTVLHHGDGERVVLYQRNVGERPPALHAVPDIHALWLRNLPRTAHDGRVRDQLAVPSRALTHEAVSHKAHPSPRAPKRVVGRQPGGGGLGRVPAVDGTRRGTYHWPLSPVQCVDLLPAIKLVGISNG